MQFLCFFQDVFFLIVTLTLGGNIYSFDEATKPATGVVEHLPKRSRLKLGIPSSFQ